MSKLFTFLNNPRTWTRLSRMRRRCSNGGRYLRVLGIESSCDDTGAAVVDSDGKILGEALNSQTKISVDMGGVMPFLAQNIHKAHIDGVVIEALRNAQMDVSDVDAIACTNRPGLVMSLRVGLNYAKQLVEKFDKPFIPIHHMKAHALTVRMIKNVEFPYLVLLVSGGHGLLTLAQGLDDFLTLGKCFDVAPGDAFDKTARLLKLKNVLECYGLSGGASIELMARSGNPTAFDIPYVMPRQADCNFSFAGIQEHFKRLIKAEEQKQNVVGSGVLPNVSDICANFQYAVLTHIAKRVHRGLLYCELLGLLPEKNKVLVISGGVGSNQFLRDGLAKLCSQYDCEVICPPPKLCTDNGIMIAWNGVEKLRMNSGIAPDPQVVDVERKSDIGEDVTDHVAKLSIKTKTIKLL